MPSVTRQLPFFFPFPSVRGSRWLAVFRKRPFFPTPVCGFPLPSVTNFPFPVFSPVVTTAFVMGHAFLFTLSLTFLCKKVLLGLLGMQRRAFTSKSSIVHKVVLTPQFVFCIDNNMDLSLQHQPEVQHAGAVPGLAHSHGHPRNPQSP